MNEDKELPPNCPPPQTAVPQLAPSPKDNPGRRRAVGIALFVLMNVAVIMTTAYFDFVEGGTPSRHDLLDITPVYLLAAFWCFAIAVAAETMKYYIMQEHLGCGASVPTAFKVAVLGRYYDNITPFGAGGQPFQVMFLRRSGLPSGAATTMSIAGFISSQAAFIFIAILVFCFRGAMKIDSAAVFVPATVGFMFYVLTPSAVVLFAISPKMTTRVIALICSAGGKLRLLKRPQSIQDRAVVTLTESRVGMAAIIMHRGMTVNIMLLSLVYQLALCSMPYFVLKMFGSDLGFFSVFCTTVFIYLCITFVPTPGNSGMAEGSFYTLFSVLGQAHLFWAMLLWRFFCYWSFVITGFVVISVNAVSTRRRAPPSRGGGDSPPN
jgi:uncharacterized protein (TIRG00374 family)